MKPAAGLVRVALGALMAWGAVMHFTVDQRVWKSDLLDSMAHSGFLWREIGIINIAAGVALLMNRCIPAATLALAPITFNIFLFHAFRHDVYGLTIGIPVFALNIALLVAHRTSYVALLRSATPQQHVTGGDGPDRTW